MGPAALLHPTEVIVGAIEAGDQRPATGRPEQGSDNRTGPMGIPVEETGGRGRQEHPQRDGINRADGKVLARGTSTLRWYDSHVKLNSHCI
ncbi:MAG: hypothetical protein NVS2B16_35200 [Chloroflexota bacterium]